MASRQNADSVKQFPRFLPLCAHSIKQKLGFTSSKMAIVPNGVYRKLMFAIAVICVIIITYIYAIYLDNVGKPNSKHAVTAQNNPIANDSGSINVRDEVMIPGQYAWIPYPVKRNPSGPFILKTINGEAIKYTNYTFYPLTFNSSFLINNPNICKDTENLTFLIMVHTAVLHFDRRKSLRETWANPRLLKNYPSRIVFLVGRTRSNSSQKAVEIENENFKDIVQGDFIDDYHNLTHKGILGYRWIVNYCENAKLILKIDDDMFVNIFLVIHELLPTYQERERIIYCRFLTDATFAREGKYAVDPDYFPGYQRSPLQYCTGAFVLMRRNIVSEMYESAKSIPFYWVDDFYLFGILPNQIPNISFHFVGNVDNNEETSRKCFQGENPCTFLAAYAWTQGVMYTYWDATLVMYKDLVQKYAMEVR